MYNHALIMAVIMHKLNKEIGTYSYTSLKNKPEGALIWLVISPGRENIPLQYWLIARNPTRLPKTKGVCDYTAGGTERETALLPFTTYNTNHT